MVSGAIMMITVGYMLAHLNKNMPPRHLDICIGIIAVCIGIEAFTRW